MSSLKVNVWFVMQGASTSATENFGHRAKRARVSGKSQDLPGECKVWSRSFNCGYIKFCFWSKGYSLIVLCKQFGLGFFSCCLYFSCSCGAVSPREASGWSRSEDILLPAGAGSVPGCLRMQAIQWACKWPHSLVRIFTWWQQIDLQKHMNVFNSKSIEDIL